MTHPDFEESLKERQDRSALVQRLWQLAGASTYSELPPDCAAGLHPSQSLSMRCLFESEIRTLTTVCRCRSQDWSKVRFVIPAEKQGLDQSNVLQRHISDTAIEGNVVFVWPGAQAGEDADPENNAWKKKLPIGLHSNVVISDSIVHLNARVHRNTYIGNSFIGPEAVVLNCGNISWDDNYALGVLSLTVGPERGGGRDIKVQPEATLQQVVQQMTSCKSANIAAGIPVSMNILDHHSVVRDTPTVESVYLHPQASITGASAVHRAVLCSTASIGTSSTADKVLLQWNSSITDGSSVSEALLMEEAHAGPQSTLVSSVLGPDVHVSTGEIHASVLGPNTNAHHQSLLIGVLWPLGRGNVGYGANVGSNHTGRLPDQECSAGEGTFWGLSSVIKFPIDLSAASYTIVAAGTSVPPQRVTMPFSLIVTGEGNVNDIIPGWLLRSSPYTLARSEEKYATRRKAARHSEYTGWKIIRAETVALCLEARSVLQGVDEAKPIYLTEREMAGIGANRLAERGRKSGIEAYTQCIQRYALQGLLEYVLKNGGRSMDLSVLQQELAGATTKPELVNNGVAWNIFPWEMTMDDWTFQRYLLAHEFPMMDDGDAAEWLNVQLRQLVTLEKGYAERIFKSKNRDDIRGGQTIPGYSDAHIPADQDPVIQKARADAKELEEKVAALLDEKDGVQSSKL